MSERNFYESPLKKVIGLISIHEEIRKKIEIGKENQEVQEIHSMKEIEGWLNE